MFKPDGGIIAVTVYRSGLAGAIRVITATRATATTMITPITGRATTIGLATLTMRPRGITAGSGATGIITIIGDCAACA